MLHYDRTHISEGIDVNKSSPSKKFIFCPYEYFLVKD